MHFVSTYIILLCYVSIWCLRMRCKNYYSLRKGVGLSILSFSCIVRMGTNVSKRFKADLEALHRNDPTLTVLNYEELGTGDEGARVLADALRGNRTVKRLRLGQCGLTALGLQRLCRALCDTSVTPCHLRRLDLVSITSLYYIECLYRYTCPTLLSPSLL